MSSIAIDYRETMPEKLPLQLNIGCGVYHRPGFINIDRNPLLKPPPDLIRDAARGLPFADSTVDAVFTSHSLEHFAHDDLIFVIGEIYRVLKPLALWEIVVPLGNHGCLDHKILFCHDSFDQLLRDGDQDYFQVKMAWEEVASSRRIYKGEGRRESRECMDLTLRAVK